MYCYVHDCTSTLRIWKVCLRSSDKLLLWDQILCLVETGIQFIQTFQSLGLYLKFGLYRSQNSVLFMVRFRHFSFLQMIKKIGINTNLTQFTQSLCALFTSVITLWENGSNISTLWPSQAAANMDLKKTDFHIEYTKLDRSLTTRVGQLKGNRPRF